MKRLIITVVVVIFVLGVNAQKETVLFDLKFGFIKGGEAHLVISDTIFNNQKAKHYYVAGRTTGLPDKLFGVNDIYQTTVSFDSRLPLKSIRNIKEGKYKWYNETLFYHDIDSINSQRSGWRSVPDNLVDIISVFFYFIENYLDNGMQQGLEVTMPTYHADKISDVTVKYLGDQNIQTDKGTINCYLLAPVVEKGKVLRRSDGLKFFVSKETKLPILLEFDMRVGTLRAELKSYKINGKEQALR